MTPAETPAPRPVSSPASSPGPNRAAATPSLLDKARAVTAKVTRLARDFDGAHRLAHQAQVREALTRTELTLALHQALGARADLAAQLREAALAAYAARGPDALRRHNRISRRIDRLLVRLGSVGQALVIARSGVWTSASLRHLAAYARRGPNPAVAAPGPFDQAWYLAAHPDVARSGLAPLVHYLVAGGLEGRRPALLFDPHYYRGQHAHELAATSVTPFEHYRRVGVARAASPHPLFDVGHYLAQRPDLEPGEDALSHYVRTGAARGLSPHPLFDPAWYAEQAPGAGLAHYLTVGWREGLTPHPLFDPSWYRAQNPDVAEADLEPLTHFVLAGGQEGRSPSPWFDLPHYVVERGAGLAAGANPLVDYLAGGAWAVAEARPGFPTAAYLAARPDLVRAGITPLEHWARTGGR